MWNPCVCECSILITYCSYCIYMLCKCFLLMLNVITWSHDNLQYDCLSVYFLQIYSHNYHILLFRLIHFVLQWQCYVHIWKIRDFKYDSKFLIHSFWFYVDQVKLSWLLCSKDGLYQGLHTNTIPNTILDKTSEQYQYPISILYQISVDKPSLAQHPLM